MNKNFFNKLSKLNHSFNELENSKQLINEEINDLLKLCNHHSETGQLMITSEYDPGSGKHYDFCFTCGKDLKHYKKEKDLQLRTSEEWSLILEDYPIVMDPDGWDRKNFEYSWYQEKISKKEYLMKCMSSTCIYDNNLKIKKNNIWNNIKNT